LAALSSLGVSIPGVVYRQSQYRYVTIPLHAFPPRINADGSITPTGNAKIEGMLPDLNMTGTDYNVALAIFFVPYVLCGTFSLYLSLRSVANL
jgi:hypothetical protein